MPGVGTKSAITPVKMKGLGRAVVLDLSRLSSRTEHAYHTGVDRVEYAYFERFLAGTETIYGLIGISGRFYLLDWAGCLAFKSRLDGACDFGQADVLSRLRFKQKKSLKRVESDLRRIACGKCDTAGLQAMFDTHLPRNVDYYNTGHSNLIEPVAREIVRRPGWRFHVLLHDTIPLDFPEFQRPGTPEIFRKKMWIISDYADRVICNSQATADAALRHFTEMGRVPPFVVAHLGVTAPTTGEGALPKTVPVGRPYFVMVGTLEPRKNHLLLLDVWRKLLERLGDDAMPHLVFAGRRGWNNEELFLALDSLGPLKNHVTEIADLDDAALWALVAGARAALFPSLAEGFGLPPAEALMLGTPVIVSDLPVYREFLGNLPVYLNPHDRYSWVETIENKFLQNNVSSKAKIQPGLPDWEAHFNIVLS